MKKKKRVQLSEQEIKMLHFLWKWKVSTTSMLSDRFYSKRSLRAAYERLNKLENAGWIECYYHPLGKASLWQLTKQSFEILSEQLPELKQNGYLSEAKIHDALVAAFQLGEDEDSHSYYSEQYLRRFENNSHPLWIPESDVHRPDGYTYQNKNKKLVAIEVELSKKKATSYDGISIFYDYEEKIDAVAWLVKHAQWHLSIQAYFLTNSRRAPIHYFLTVSDFIKYGWSAELKNCEDRTISGFELLSNSGQTSLKPVRYRKALDVRKSPHKSTTYLSLSI